jgi:hypothetical protein
VAGIEVIRAPDAPLGGGDPTRRHAVLADGLVLLPGLTRPEADDACRWLGAMAGDDRPLALAEVALPVVLTDGAGPHLLDADGSLVLALGPHPAIAGALVAMGAPTPLHAVGLVTRVGGGGWAWLARARVADSGRVDALDGLEAVVDASGLRSWAARWAAVMSTLAP